MAAVVPRVDTHSTRCDVIDSKHGRILCVADVRGALSTLNALAAEHHAVAIIHSGDFGFYEPSSIASISDRTLKHLIQYSSLISPQFRSQLLNPSTSPLQIRQLLTNSNDFVLSEFPKLVSGDLKLNVPVYTVWGACEDVQILEKIRLAAPASVAVPTDPTSQPPVPPSTTSAPDPASLSTPASATSLTSSYSIPNLTVLDEATTRVLEIGGIRLRLFGLGGAVVPHKLFDNGSGNATIAGGMGTMWTTMLQIGELVDTAQKVYDPTETRLLITHASPGREGLISQLSLVLKADLTVSAGLHFRYGVSYNEFSVTWDPETFKQKLEASRKAFGEVWDAVKTQVEGVVDENQKALLANALAVANRVPASAPVQGGPAAEETAWKNCWNWNLPDAAFGSLVLDIREGRIGSEMKSQGFNFAYRSSTAPSTPSAPHSGAPVPPRAAAGGNSTQSVGAANRPQSSQFPSRGFPPHHQHHQQQQQHRGPRGGFQGASVNAAPTPPAANTKEPTEAASSTKPSSSASASAPPATTVNGTSTAINSTTIPTGPRNPQHQQQNRPPSRSTQQPSLPATSTTTTTTTTTTGEASSAPVPASTNKASSDPAAPVEPNSATSPAPGSSSVEAVVSPTTGAPPNTQERRQGGGGGGGGGRGRGGRGGGGNNASGSRGRSNGEWRGRGRGGAGGSGSRQASTSGNAGGGDAGGAGTPNAGGEKASA